MSENTKNPKYTIEVVEGCDNFAYGVGLSPEREKVLDNFLDDLQKEDIKTVSEYLKRCVEFAENPAEIAYLCLIYGTQRGTTMFKNSLLGGFFAKDSKK